MLLISLVLSSIYLLLVNWSFRHQAHRVSLSWTFAFGVLPMFCIGYFPPLILQALLLAAVLGLCHFGQRGPRCFLVLSYVATAAPYVVLSILAYRECAQWHEEFPYESMEEHLRPPPAARPGLLPVAARRRLANLEEALSDTTNSNWLREGYLRQLHEQTVEVFINRPGFGVARMVPEKGRLTWGLRQGPPILQPGPPISLVLSPGEMERESPPLEQGGLSRLHEESVLDFVNPNGFGFIKDRRHVAGFQPHQFSRLPNPRPRWELQHLDLVGLLRHDTPVVYVSEHLPRMDELREAPTRSLDVFELAGLAALQKGEDFFVRDTPDGVRMQGAIRSVKQCVDCHGGETGDLLGAFSYSLRRGDR